MGCFHSKTAHIHSPEDPPAALPDSKHPDPGHGGDDADQECLVPAFKEYGLSELRRATN